MSLDRRVRDELEALASSIQPDVEANLQASLRRASSRSRRRGAAMVLAFAAVVVTVVVIGPGMLQAFRSNPIQPGGVASPAIERLSGPYTVTVASDDAEILRQAMNGEWTVEFGDDGILGIAAPADFTGTRTGYSFEITGDQLRTDLFSADVCTGLIPGVYAWELTDGVLTLTVLEDACAGRTALLTAEWRSTTGSE